VRHELLLSALKGDSPIGAMAAFGVLRVCSQLPQLGDPRLHWRCMSGRWVAVLSSIHPLSADDLTAALVSYMADVRNRPEFTWSEQIKSVTKAHFRHYAGMALAGATPADHRCADWFNAFGSELMTEEDVIVPTPFDMTVARQKFLADALKLGTSLKGSSGRDAFREALFGPWQYADDQHSLGWDPSNIRLGAFTTDAPTKMANTGVRGAVWLAFESLPLFPCFVATDKLRTRAIRSEGRSDVLVWPVWSCPLTLVAVETLLSLRELSGNAEAAIQRGVEAVYRSTQFKPNKYMITFQWPMLVAGGMGEKERARET
jgi:hypothetical protein